MQQRRHYFTFVLLIICECVLGILSKMCYSCTDIASNEQCFNVTKCPPDEMCYGRADNFLTGVVKYSTGCTKELKPQVRSDGLASTLCKQSCDQDLCNLYECMPANKTTRGPRCRSCKLIERPELCDKVIECASNEMCFISRLTNFNKTFYRQGCVQKQHCTSQHTASNALVGKRWTISDCSKCCSDDHCNSVCENSGFHLATLSNEYFCVDEDLLTCATFGKLSQDACMYDRVLSLCRKSCAFCDYIEWTPWSLWTGCSAPCDGWTSRRRTCVKQTDASTNLTCIGNNSETKRCSAEYCPRVCTYKGQFYTQNQTWNDGCSQSCTCTNADQGHYVCRALCLNWNGLPPICLLEDPRPPLCCQQPRCPDGIIINIPKAYKDQYPGYTYVTVVT